MNLWLAQHFLNPALVGWGLLLIAVPIIIHLINRFRFKRVKFAAMEFLLQSQKRNQRKVLIEQLLLLLTRIMIVCGIVLLISRLIIDPKQISLFQGAETKHIVLLDDSGSMRDTWGDTNAFREGLNVVKKIISEGARQSGKQEFTLVLLSKPETSISNLNEREINESLLVDFTDRMPKLETACTYEQQSPVSGIRAIINSFKDQQATVKNLHLISDFREIDWLAQKALVGELKAAEEAGFNVNLVKTVKEQHQNVSIVNLEGNLESASAGIPLRFHVTVMNQGISLIPSLPLSIKLNGNKLPMNVTVENLEPGKSLSEHFDVVFDSPGLQELTVSCPDDALAQDNQRFVAVDVAQNNQVLIIDGNPGSNDGTYVLDALSADPTVTGITATLENIDYLRKQPLKRYGMIYLLNVPQMPVDAYEALKSYVTEGGGLAWFLGDKVLASFYNEQLYENGQGLFAVPLAPTPSVLPRADETNPGADLKLADHPVFKVLNAENGLLLAYLEIYRYFSPPAIWEKEDRVRQDRVRTIGSFRNGQPALLEYNFGRGKVILSMSSVGPEAKLETPNERWNNWPLGENTITFPIFHLELAQYLLRKDRQLPQYTSGEVLTFKLDPATYSENIEIRMPEAAGGRVYPLKAALNSEPISENANATNISPLLVEKFSQTDVPGIYRIKLTTQSQSVEEKWVAYNAPPQEGNLAISSTEALKKQLTTETKVSIQEPGSFNWIESREAGQDVRNFLLWGIIIFLLAEQFMAYKFSYHNNNSGVPA